MIVADLVIIAIDCMENLDDNKIEDLVKKSLCLNINLDKILFVFN